MTQAKRKKGIYFYFRCFRHIILLLENQITIYCNHANLNEIKKYFITQLRDWRWMSILKNFKYDTIYRPKDQNTGPDNLLRPTGQISTIETYASKYLFNKQIETIMPSDIDHEYRMGNLKQWANSSEVGHPGVSKILMLLKQEDC
jgi:hypothetical protein